VQTFLKKEHRIFYILNTPLLTKTNLLRHKNFGDVNKFNRLDWVRLSLFIGFHAFINMLIRLGNYSARQNDKLKKT